MFMIKRYVVEGLRGLRLEDLRIRICNEVRSVFEQSLRNVFRFIAISIK